jgi:tetratricopeptide (TPR) repeat protein
VVALIYHDSRITDEQQQTVAQLGMTRDVLRYLLDMAGQVLAYFPNSEQHRAYVATRVLERYEKLGAQFKNDPGVRLEIAQVHRVIGGIARITGQFDESLTSYNQAIGILERLTKDFPGQPNYLYWFVEAHNDRGELYHMNGPLDSAIQDFERALVQARGLPFLAATDMYHRARAKPLINLSEVLALQNNVESAYDCASEAVTLLRPLAVTRRRLEATNDAKSRASDDDGAQETRLQDQWLLAMALTDRGAVAIAKGLLERAQPDLEEAEAICNRILETNPDHADAQLQLAWIYNRLGELFLVEPAASEKAEKHFGQAEKRLRQRVSNNKLIPLYRLELAATLTRRADSRCSLGPTRLKDADADCSEAISLIEALNNERLMKKLRDNPDYFSALGRAHRISSRIADANGNPAGALEALKNAERNMKQAVEIDGSRARDRAELERLSTKLKEIDRQPK